MDLSSFKTTFDGVLQTYIHDKIDYAKSLINDKKINTYIDYIATFIFSGGKRNRPYGLRLIYTWFGWNNEKAILKFGIVFELLHSFALIHDDIIDESDKRHNILTVHSHIQTVLKDNSHAKHIGEAHAILIWDLLFSRVYELLHKQHDFPEDLLWEARTNIDNMIEEVILWEMIDVDMTVSEPASLWLIDKKNMYKTASYTFIRPMLTWAILADAPEHQKQLIIELGKYMGMVFQMRDDYLDVMGGDKTKSTFSDTQEWQQTYFTNYIFEKWTSQQKELLQSSMGKPLDNKHIQVLQKMFEESGALAFGKQSIIAYSQKAKDILAQTQLNDEAKKSILALIAKMEKLEH